jgi:hypothetical protein
MLSVSAVAGPMPALETLNVQLQPGPGGSLSQLMPPITAAGATVQSTTISGLYEVQGPSASMAALAQQLSASSAVPYADPTQMLRIATDPNDPFYRSQWGIDGTWGINAPSAWNTTTGSNKVIVADVDTGINYNLRAGLGRPGAE